MSREQLALEAMALRLAERVALAQALWRSIHAGSTAPTVEDETEATWEAARRDLELPSASRLTSW